MRQPLKTEEEIIQAGEEITAERGDIATAWQIHQRLGRRGNIERYKAVWSKHCQTRTAPSPAIEIVVPEATQARIDDSVQTLGASMTTIVADIIRDQLDQARRQISLAQQAHDHQLREVIEERDYLIDYVSGLEDALERAEKEVSALERKLARTGSPKPARGKGAQPGTKSRRQSPGKTRQKPAPDSAEETAPSPS